MNPYDPRPFRDHRDDPPISVYVLDNKSCNSLEKISCMHCKRPVWDMYGRIDKLIMTPMPVEEFGAAINIRCKLCHQNYRLLINAKY